MQFIPKGHTSIFDATTAVLEHRFGPQALSETIDFTDATKAEVQRKKATERWRDCQAVLAAGLAAGTIVALTRDERGHFVQVPKWYWVGAEKRLFGMTGLLEFAGAAPGEWKPFHHRPCSIETDDLKKFVAGIPRQHWSNDSLPPIERASLWMSSAMNAGVTGAFDDFFNWARKDGIDVTERQFREVWNRLKTKEMSKPGPKPRPSRKPVVP